MTTFASRARGRLSVVVPMYNESESVEHFLRQLGSALDELSTDFEIVLVDDGSTDGTAHLAQCCARPELRIVAHSENRGYAAAIWTGLQAATGSLVVTMDGDMQHPPSLIAQMLEAHMRHDADVVYAIRSNLGVESLLKRATSLGFPLLVRSLYGMKIVPMANDFRLVTADVIDRVRDQVGENTAPVLRAILPALDVRSAQVPFSLSSRFAGVSKFSLRKMVQLLVETISYGRGRRLMAVLATAGGVAALALACSLRALMTGLTGLGVVVVMVAGAAFVCSTALVLVTVAALRRRRARLTAVRAPHSVDERQRLGTT